LLAGGALGIVAGALGAGALIVSGPEAGGVAGVSVAAAGAEVSSAVFFLQPLTAIALTATPTTSAVFQSIFMPGSFEAPLTGLFAHDKLTNV
jgi:hypothetical protein